MAHTYDIIIVGGGAIGAACARELAAKQRKLAVVEPGTETGQAWRAAAGMLAPQIEADGKDPLLPFAVRARDYYETLAQELRDTTGLDLGLWREGIARVALDQGDAETLHDKIAWQQEHGYACEWLEAEDLRRRWPWLGPAVGALWASHDGALDPERLVQALLADAQRLGTSMIEDRIVRLDVVTGRIAGVVGQQRSYSAPTVILAAGAWSPQIEGLPRPLPVQPVRGQMAALPWPAGMPRSIVYHKDSYLLARGAEAILGSTMEYVGFHPEVTPAGLAQILSSTMALCPELARAKLRRTWAGLRPVTPDGLPLIGADPELPGLWYATGHGRNGILLAGLTGRVVTQLVMGEIPELDLSGFRPERFGAP